MKTCNRTQIVSLNRKATRKRLCMLMFQLNINMNLQRSICKNRNKYYSYTAAQIIIAKTERRFCLIDIIISFIDPEYQQPKEQNKPQIRL
jgi:hypothetical protein